jgi:hypothetical protein
MLVTILQSVSQPASKQVGHSKPQTQTEERLAGQATSDFTLLIGVCFNIATPPHFTKVPLALLSKVFIINGHCCKT